MHEPNSSLWRRQQLMRNPLTFVFLVWGVMFAVLGILLNLPE